MWQRWPHLAAIVLALLAILLRAQPAASRAVTALAALAILVSRRDRRVSCRRRISLVERLHASAPRRCLSGSGAGHPAPRSWPRRSSAATRRNGRCSGHVAGRLQRDPLASAFGASILWLMRQARMTAPSRPREHDAMIRVDQAGEFGATRIYAGQLAVLGDRRRGRAPDRAHGRAGGTPPPRLRRDDGRARRAPDPARAVLGSSPASRSARRPR